MSRSDRLALLRAAILGVVATYAASSAAREAWGAEGDDEPPSYGGGGIGDFGF